jgi:hypothetical protein
MEKWRDIPGFEGRYQASNMGRIKSLVRRKERILKLVKDRRGYMMVGLRIDKKTLRQRVHRLVSKDIPGQPAKKLEVNHLDGNKTNNQIGNLEWTTPSENQIHAYKTGLNISLRGEKRKNRKSFINILNLIEHLLFKPAFLQKPLNGYAKAQNTRKRTRATFAMLFWENSLPPTALFSDEPEKKIIFSKTL